MAEEGTLRIDRIERMQKEPAVEEALAKLPPWLDPHAGDPGPLRRSLSRPGSGLRWIESLSRATVRRAPPPRREQC